MACALVAVGLGACSGSPSPPKPPLTSPTELSRLRLACSNGSIEACDEEALAASLCLVQPDGWLCDELRARGEIPVSPPPVTSLLGCWQTSATGRGRTVWCFAPRTLSKRTARGVWDQWNLDGWTRDDRPRQASYRAETSAGQRIWMSPRGARLHVADSVGAWNALLERGTGPLVERELATLATLETVCELAADCAVAIHQAQTVGEELDDFSFEVGQRSLGECRREWRRLVDDFVVWNSKIGLPSVCGTVHQDAPMGIRVVDPPVSLDPARAGQPW